MPKGILWVSSRVIHPQHLTPEKFCKWYENIHIQQVLALPGVPSAVRYEALTPQPDATAWSNAAPWLTVYEMPDITYRESAEFKALDGQSEPDSALLEGIFKHARFDTRFYEEVQDFENEQGDSPASFLISAALQPAPGADDDFDTWYRTEHIPILAQAPGYLRTRRYVLVDATTLDSFVRTTHDVGEWSESSVRSEAGVPRYLALHEFKGDVLPWKELVASAQTEWAKRVMGGLAGEEVGWYVGKRGYEGGDEEEGAGVSVP